ncbi:MAG TPA: AraC family transcriptional regulator [Candidatus Anaerobiospirillum pullistercoris]|uniref:AraC family transcriptional regulator n=1 Tax=Candidatus Anaerobiospirillum pullistercoris TaxID=2838452 RepID=A0A9D2B0C6_9GAMM|nr:AraC family transcriptional regulator [Candidatus Anaerobiospirillum pullistercoris]
MSEIEFAPISHDSVTFERESVLRALCSKLPLVLERSVSDQVSWCSGQIEVLRVTSSPESSAKIAKRKLSVVLVLSAASPLSAESVSPDFFIVGASSCSMTKELRRALSQASATHPCYMLTVSLNPELLQEVVSQVPHEVEKAANMPVDSSVTGDQNQCSGNQNCRATQAELMTLERMVDLHLQGIDYDLPFLLLLKELYFFVLLAPHGHILRQLFSHGAPEYKIAQAISFLRANLRSDITMESLAAEVYMAVPTFYKHFKQITSLSPLQYLKRLRLYEARRLMLTESLTAAAASYEVGYMSEQHFSRDYKKLFGRPPLQDLKPIFAAHL